MFLLTAVFTLSIFGQEADNTDWSLNDCIDYALVNNIQVNQSKMRVLSANADLIQARGLRLPSLSSSLSQSFTNNKRFNEMEEYLGWGSSYGGTVSINSGLVLYQGGNLMNNVRKQEKNKEAALLNVEQAEMDITLAVIQAYLNILYANENEEYYNEIVTTTKKQLDRVKAMLEAGSLSRRDVADMEAQLATDQYMLVMARNTRTTRITDLKQLLEIPPENNFMIALNIELPEITDPVPDKFLVFDKVLTNRPEMRYIHLEKELSELAISEARSGYLPTLTMNLSANTSYNSLYSSRYGSQMSDNMSQYVGLNLSIPVFSRFENKAALSRAVINDQITGLTINNTRNQLLQVVETVYEDTRAGQERHLAAIAQESASYESFILAQEQYHLGMLSTVELLQVRSQYLNSRNELIQARFTSLFYRKILDYYMGIPVSL